MAKIDDIAQRVSNIEGWMKGLGVAGVIALGLSGWALYQISVQGRQLVALQTYITHQLPQIAANIVSRPTTNKAEAAHNLESAKSILTNARRDNINLTSSGLVEIGKALQSRATADSDLPEYWQTAAELVTYRSQAQSSFPTIQTTNCWSEWSKEKTAGEKLTDQNGNLINPDQPTPQGTGGIRLHIHMANCVVQLDDINGFNDSGIPDRLEQVRRTHPGLPVVLLLTFHGANVVYRGGQVVPANLIAFNQCSLEFSFNALPPPKGQLLTASLLTANLEEIQVILGSV